MRMAELAQETALDRADMEIMRLENEVMMLKRALNDIIALEVVHSGLSTAGVIQQACDIARVAIYGKTRRQSMEEAKRYEQ